MTFKSADVFFAVKLYAVGYNGAALADLYFALRLALFADAEIDIELVRGDILRLESALGNDYSRCAALEFYGVVRRRDVVYAAHGRYADYAVVLDERDYEAYFIHVRAEHNLLFVLSRAAL